jgi:hypothetical protein
MKPSEFKKKERKREYMHACMCVYVDGLDKKIIIIRDFSPSSR